MKFNVTAFHGSPTSVINKFNLASHFGTYEQALSAIGAKVFLDSPRSFYTSDEVKAMTANIHQVEIVFDESLLVTFSKDWGAPGAQGVLVALLNHYRNKPLSDAIRDSLKVINSIEDEVARNITAEKMLSLHAQGIIDVISYQNEVENEGTSYCLINPNCIHSHQQSIVKWVDVINEFKKHPDYRLAVPMIDHFMENL